MLIHEDEGTVCHREELSVAAQPGGGEKNERLRVFVVAVVKSFAVSIAEDGFGNGGALEVN